MMAGAPGSEPKPKPVAGDPTADPTADASTCFDILTENFATLARAKGGIPKLRETILQLAVQGRLVPQDPADEPASVLLERIQKEKARLVREKTIKKSKPLPPVDADEVPHRIPLNWEWGHISDFFISLPISKYKIRNSEISDSGRYPVIDQSKDFIAGYYNDSSKLVKLNDPLVIFGDHTREIKYIDFDFVPGADGTKVLCPLNGFAKYFYLFLKSLNFEKKGYSRHFKFLKENYFPLPPLPEQHRIVERAYALMALCDELEARQDAEAKRRRMLLESVLHALQDGTDPEGVAAAREIFAANFDLLVDDTESIAELRKTILQLAVQGRLVEQDPADEPASVLLERISAEKARLVKEKKIKKAKPLPPVDVDEVPYALPEGWIWTRLDEICFLITDGTHHTPTYTEEGVRFLSVKDLSNGFIDLSNTRYISEEEHLELIKRCHPEYGDVLLTKVGTTGIAKVIDVDVEFSIFVSVALLKFSKGSIFPYFLELMINSPLVKYQSEVNTQGVGNKNLVLKSIKKFVVPLPPLPEQHRIVERVDALMKLCDKLDARVRAQEDAAERLLASVCDGICG